MNLGRKITGGKYHALRKKRFHERHGRITAPSLGEPKKKNYRTRGGHVKIFSLSENRVNIQSGKSSKKAQIINVIETPQNKFLARQNRLAKGVIIETSMGKAKITNRPSREGIINAVLVEKK